MTWTRAERLAYGRGYNAGRAGKWPGHLPPAPPEPVVRELMDAVARIRDAANDWRAQISPDDEWVTALDDMIDAADAGVSAVSDWLLEAAGGDG